MPQLREPLNDPRIYLAGLSLLLAAGVADTLRCPADQATARVYLGLVRVYQTRISPLLEGHVRCRYVPTCSSYSVEAVERFGILRGLYMTACRIRTCQRNVPFRTSDPVPTRCETAITKPRVGADYVQSGRKSAGEHEEPG